MGKDQVYQTTQWTKADIEVILNLILLKKTIRNYTQITEETIPQTKTPPGVKFTITIKKTSKKQQNGQTQQILKCQLAKVWNLYTKLIRKKKIPQNNLKDVPRVLFYLLLAGEVWISMGVLIASRSGKTWRYHWVVGITAMEEVAGTGGHWGWRK